MTSQYNNNNNAIEIPVGRRRRGTAKTAHLSPRPTTVGKAHDPDGIKRATPSVRPTTGGTQLPVSRSQQLSIAFFVRLYPSHPLSYVTFCCIALLRYRPRPITPPPQFFRARETVSDRSPGTPCPPQMSSTACK